MFVIFPLIFWSRVGCLAVMGSGALAPFSGAASLCSEEEMLDLLLGPETSHCIHGIYNYNLFAYGVFTLGQCSQKLPG